MKKSSLSLFILFFAANQLFPQTHLSLDIKDPIYTLLEIAEIKGFGMRLSAAKPYSRSSVNSIFDKINSRSGIFSTQENLIIDQFLIRLSDTSSFFKPTIKDKGFLGSIEAGINLESDVNLNFNDLSAWHLFSSLNFYLKGDINDFLSYSTGFAGTYDKVNSDSFAPYSFTKKWDGFHIGFTEPRYSNTGEEAVPYFSFIINDETTAQFFDDNLTLSFSRFRRDWGTGEGNLYLSGSARPYQGFDIHARLAEWCNFSWTTGSLNDWAKENKIDAPNDSSYQKMVTVQMLEFFPADWFYLSTVATAIWGKRFELIYLSPLLYPVIAQNTIGDFDNISQAVNMIFFLPGYAKIYFSFFADEMEFTSLDQFFKRPRNMVAYQAGTKAVIPWLPLSLLTIQYTKIEPFVYAHYPETDIQPLGHPVDMSFTNDGENIGFHLPPNSDELLVQVETMPIPNIGMTLAYSLIRHGTNGGDPLIDNRIYGEVSSYFIYEDANLYPDKDFLHDGSYDWNNIISIKIQVIIPEYYLTFTCGYSFAHTFWVTNASGEPTPADIFRNIFSFSFSYNYL